MTPGKALDTAHDGVHRRMGQVVAYGISINLVEVTWKSKIKAQFPNPNDYSAFMGDFSSATGAVTFIMMLLSRFIFRKVRPGGPSVCLHACMCTPHGHAVLCKRTSYRVTAMRVDHSDIPAVQS